MALRETLESVKALKAELDAARPIDPQLMARIMQKFRLDWNYHSNHIEGNSLTYGETKSFLLHGITADGKPFRDHLDIKGHNEALQLLEDVLKEKHPLTEVFIRGLHKLILKEPYEKPAQTPEGLPTTRTIEVGKYKSVPNHVRTVTGEIFKFTSPEATPAEMEKLLAWYREKRSDEEYDPVQLAALFHYRFIRIHPFDDGNGRIARILMNLILMGNAFPPVVIKTDEKDNYFRALRQADGGSLDRFVEYVGKELIKSLELMLSAARGKNFEDEDDLEKEIALWERENESAMERRNVLQSSPETHMRLYNALVVPFAKKLSDATGKLADFFDHREIRISSGGHIIEQFRDGEFLAEGEYVEPRNQNSFEVVVFLEGYNRHASSVFEMSRRAEIFLYKYEYEVHFGPDLQNIRRPYGQSNSAKEISEWATALARSLFVEMKEKASR